MARAERELTDTEHDETVIVLLSEIRGYAPPGPDRSQSRVTAADLLLPIHLLVNGVELRMFSTIMTLGTPRDVTLQELRVETFFPADAGSEAAGQRCWRRGARPTHHACPAAEVVDYWARMRICLSSTTTWWPSAICAMTSGVAIGDNCGRAAAGTAASRSPIRG